MQMERSRLGEAAVSALSVFAFLVAMALISLAVWALLDLIIG